MPDRLTPQDLAGRVTVFDVDDLTLWDANPNKADEDSIHASMEEWGQTATILVATDGNGRRVVVDGNHRVAAERKARRFGGKLAGIDVTGLDWTDVRAFAAGLALNRTARLGADDEGLLAAILTQIGAEDATLLRAMAYTDGDLASLLEADGLDDGDNRIAGDPDDIPDQVPPVTQLGDVWLLGEHRVMAGDANHTDAQGRLLDGARPGIIYTDPPYGMNLQADYTKFGHGQGKAHRQIEGDDRPFDAAPLIAAFRDVPEQFWWGADYYRTTILSGGSWIVWDKRDNDEGMALDELLGAQFELCWSRQRHRRQIARVLWAMTHGQQRDNEDARRGLHPTQKPVDLARWFFDRWTEPTSLVLDLFAGSGSTLIAAHQTGRTAYLMELDPRYVDTICARWERATGIVPVLEATGKPVSFLTPADTPTETPGRKRRAPTG